MQRIAEYDRLKRYGRDLSEIGMAPFMAPCPAGWRVAEVTVAARALASMSLHANSSEAFFPLEGVCLLTLSADGDFRDSDTFLLDRPVVINAGVWHGLTTLSPQSRLLVAENADVTLQTKAYAPNSAEETV